MVGGDRGLRSLRRGGTRPRLAREIGLGLVVLGVTGSSFGGLLSVVAQATRALGR